MAEPSGAPAAAPDKRPRHVGKTVRKILELAKPEWKRLAAGTFFLLLASASNLAFPQGVKKILDGALAATSSAQSINRIALIMGGLFVLQGIGFAFRYWFFATAGERAVTRLRARLYETLVHQDVGFFDERRTGELQSRLSADTGVLQSAVSADISMALRHIAGVMGGIALLAFTSPKLTLTMLSVVPAVAVSAVIYGRRVRKLAREVQDALAAAGEVAEETLSGIRTVRAFSGEEAEATRYAGKVEASYLLARRRIAASSTFMGAASTAAYGAFALVFWVGGRMVLHHEISPGSLISFVLYTLMVAMSLGGLAELWAELMRATGAAERVFELLDRQPAFANRGGATLRAVRGEVKLQGVHFSYPARKDVEVLGGVDLTLAPGEIVALVGPSGGGKSTVAALVQRLYDPTTGRILLDGTPLPTLDPGWMRRQLGVVSQEPILFSTTVAENIRYGRPDATDAEVEAAARTANAHTFVAGFPDGYKTLVGERGVQLSGGQKQRVAIARAVLLDPKILILDEATSALDAESEHLVQEALDRLMVGRTTLVIAHRLSTVMRADRVVVLDGGRIVEQGPHAALVAEGGLYKRLVERQFAAG